MTGQPVSDDPGRDCRMRASSAVTCGNRAWTEFDIQLMIFIAAL